MLAPVFRIDTPGSVGGRFQDGQPYAATPQSGTIVSADWLNSISDELIGVLAAAGIPPDKANSGQLLAALYALYVQGLPPAQAGVLNAIARPWLEPARHEELIFRAHGSWTVGASGGSWPADVYEEAAGEFYNCCGPQAMTGATSTSHGIYPLDPGQQDNGPFIRRGRMGPGVVLHLRITGRLLQNDGSPRNIFLCMDPNGNVYGKANSWGSARAVVLYGSIAAGAAATERPFMWDVWIVGRDTSRQTILSRFWAPDIGASSGHRFQSGTAIELHWGRHDSANLWNFTTPLSGRATGTARFRGALGTFIPARTTIASVATSLLFRTRFPGTISGSASGTAHFTGTNGTVIPAGTQIQGVVSGLLYATNGPATIAGGVANATATAVAMGEAYNLAAGSHAFDVVGSISGLDAAVDAGTEFDGGGIWDAATAAVERGAAGNEAQGDDAFLLSSPIAGAHDEVDCEVAFANGSENYVDNKGHTILGVRWAISGAYDDTARLEPQTLEAFISRNGGELGGLA